MSFLHRLTARQLSVAALAIWCCSLPFTGLVLYSEQKHLTGLEILAMGWLSPLFLNFAWFANVFFLYGIFSLLSGVTPSTSPMFAALLSLDTVRFSQYLLNEGGSTTPIYGYGWGAVLWFASIFVLLIATGIRGRETNNLHEWYQPLGLVLLFVTLGTTLYFSFHDRAIANPTEARRLTNVAFKRGKVCGAPDPVVIDPIRNLSGPVEVVVEKSAVYANYPFTKVRDLLEWGIPTVRISGNDYSYETTVPDRLLSSVPATGAPAAILFVDESYLRFIRAKLVETSTNRTIFDQTWERENLPVNTNYYCPDYHSFPRAEEQPRQLLTQALNLQATNTRKVVQKRRVLDRVEGTTIDRKDGGQTLSMKIARWKDMNPDSRIGIPYHEIFNTNCPSDVGWTGNNYESRLNTGWPFMVKGKAYYLQDSGRHNATCEGDSAYIYGGAARDGKYYLSIEKRDFRDFRQLWGGIVVAFNVQPSMRDGALKVQSIQQSTEGVIIELVDENSGQILFVQAPLHDK